MKFGNKGLIGTTEIVGIAVAILMIAIIVPIGLDQLGSVNSDNWGASGSTLETLLVTVVPILAVIGIALKFM